MYRIFLLAALLVGRLAMAQSTDVYFASSPTLNPDGTVLVFAYESDLWRADLKTNTASRLTAMQGNETRPAISPDGQWLAFTSTQNDNADVYVMPLAGGPVRQLTFHSTFDRVSGWSWDSKTIYFESGMQNDGTTYTISREGGTPRRLFAHYFNRVHAVAEAPNGELFFNDTWESDNQAMRKGYKGDFNPDIQSYHPKTKAYKQYTTYRGKDMWATIDRAGTVYFVSDEANGEYNLYTFQNGQKTALTQFKESIKRPVVAANGGKVVFEKGYQLWTYDVASRQASPVRLNLTRNFTLPKAQDFNVRGEITAFDVAPDGKKLAFVARGTLFVSDVEGKFIRALPTRPQERVLEVKWLSDSKRVIYSQTVNGYPNWFTRPADGSGSEKQLTSDAQSNRQLVLNKDRSKGVYLSGRSEVRVIDLQSLQSETIVRDELWAFQNDDPQFSPNGEYVVFTAYRNFETDIFLHHLARKTTVNLTETGISERQPTFSPDGKYLYFMSNRLRPFYPWGGADAHIYRVPLTRLEAPYRAEQFAELFKETKKEEKKEEPAKDAKSSGKKGATPEPAKPEPRKVEPLVIDLADILDRIELVSPNFGTQSDPFVYQKGKKTVVYFISDQAEGKDQLYKVTYEPFAVTKTEKVDGVTGNYSAIAVAPDDKLFILSGGTIRKLNPETTSTEAITMDYTFRRNLADEFRQMFYEAWAGLEENFYNETFHGVDWKGLRDRYATYLPHANSRADFRVLFNDMLGELNASHLGFSSFGQEENVFFKSRTLETGLQFRADRPFVVDRVVKRSAADKHNKAVRAGDLLTHVNGQAVDTTQNRDLFLTFPSLDREVELTFRRADSSFVVRFHPQSSLNENLYDEWQDDNQKRVDERSSKRIAYVHMKNMGMGEYQKFVQDMTRDWYKKDALILDLRYNTGGNVHDMVLNFLSQRPYLQWKYREGALTPQPNFGVAGKPIVLLMNEQSLSDAEMTATGFRALKLGKIIGTETYRWIIFTSGKGLVDGSFYRLPAWGCYTLDGKNIEREGVAPDVYIKQTFVDRLEGRDPQLDRAIDELMSELRVLAEKK